MISTVSRVAGRLSGDRVILARYVLPEMSEACVAIARCCVTVPLRLKIIPVTVELLYTDVGLRLRLF